MVDTTEIGKRVVQFIIVSLPSLFMVIWTLDAALVTGADVFLISLVQVIFIGIFIAYLSRKSPGSPTATNETPVTE